LERRRDSEAGYRPQLRPAWPADNRCRPADPRGL